MWGAIAWFLAYSQMFHGWVKGSGVCHYPDDILQMVWLFYITNAMLGQTKAFFADWIFVSWSFQYWQLSENSHETIIKTSLSNHALFSVGFKASVFKVTASLLGLIAADELISYKFAYFLLNPLKVLAEGTAVWEERCLWSAWSQLLGNSSH